MAKEMLTETLLMMEIVLNQVKETVVDQVKEKAKVKMKEKGKSKEIVLDQV
jgi:hypothetical protein